MSNINVKLCDLFILDLLSSR